MAAINDNLILLSGPAACCAWSRRAVTSFEVLVAFTLLTSVLGMSVPLVVRHGRLLISARQHRLAVEELSNQLERLTTLPPGELAAAVTGLKVSEFTAANCGERR